jgi:hypothetical protein
MSQEAEKFSETKNNQVNSVGANIPPKIIPQQNLLNENTPQSPNPIPEKKVEKENLNSTLYQGSKTEENLNKNLFNTVNGFNPMNHIPPKYDIYGYLMPLEKRYQDMSILNKIDKIKIPWCEKNSNKSGATTLTELFDKRKKERIPDISYDLDKDGYVGGRDYVIAKRFDVDNDGKLNEQEKAAAYEGIKNNIESKYIWNIDKLGGVRPLRLLQKRGKFIEAEDFLPIRDTYPKHPISDIIPRCATFTELNHLRKKENIEKLNEKMREIEKIKHEKLSKNIENVNNYNIPKTIPKYTSMTQIRADKIKEQREKCGLDPITSDNRNNTKNPPSLEYIYNPKHKTKREIDVDRHKENYSESKKLAQKKHKSDIERLNEREDEIFANLYSTEERKTYTKIKEKYRKEANDYNIKTFSKQTLGVHGHDLPQFSKNEKLKYFWKNKEDYCETPKFQSQREYLESIKYYKPPGEDLYLNEHRAESQKWIDPFKKEHYPLEKKHEKKLITNLNEINIFKNFDPSIVKELEYNPKQKHIVRWTSIVNQFAPNKFKKGRFFDSLPEQKEEKNEDRDLFANLKGFMSNYMKNMLNKENEKNNKNKEKNATQSENVKPGKDLLYQKFSANTKEQNKTNGINKNFTARTKGF